MKHIWKKTAAFAAAAIMTAALAIPAVTAGASDMWADFLDEATFTKEIVVQAEEATGTVYAPVVTYSYAISPCAEADVTGKTIKDSTGNIVGVKPGDTGLLTIGEDNTATFSGTATLSSGTAKFSDTVGVTLDSTFKTPGVYRYKVTETSEPADLASVGIARPADYDDTRYIDVYVNSSGPYGIVMFASGEPGDQVTADGTQKSVGFTDTSNVTEDSGIDPTSGLADVYFLYNYTVTKKVENDALTTPPKFNFAITVNGETGQKFDNNKDIGSTVSAELGNGDSVTIKNIPANATISVSETNPNAATYEVSAKDGDATIALNATSIAKDATAQFENAEKLSNIDTAADASAVEAVLNETIFTNKQVDISVTGVLFMVAPFVLMIGAAAFLAAVVIRSRKREASENII